uniref:Uncharacterized protein n=1 Tax=Oryza brachyantha TaxID=4533 RepID=J3N871_ORYBR
MCRESVPSLQITSKPTPSFLSPNSKIGLFLLSYTSSLSPPRLHPICGEELHAKDRHSAALTWHHRRAATRHAASTHCAACVHGRAPRLVGGTAVPDDEAGGVGGRSEE